jgi:hypothetical protein
MTVSQESHMADEDRLDQLFRHALNSEHARMMQPPDLWQRVRQTARARRLAAQAIPSPGYPDGAISGTRRRAGFQPGLMLDLDR